MKHLFYLVLFFLLGSNVYAQKTAEDFLAQVPDLPNSPCTDESSDMQKFSESISKLHNLLLAEIDTRQKEVDAFLKDHQAEARMNVAKNAGFSQEDAKKMQNADKMTKEQKMALANQMMMDKMNMNLDDMKKVSAMDTASRKRWAKGYSSMAMADAMTDPKKTQEDRSKYKNEYDLIDSVTFQSEKLKAGEAKYNQQLDTLDKQADDAMKVLDKKLETMYIVTGDDNTVVNQRRALKEEYCMKFTPRYEVILAQYKIYIEKSLPDYYKLDALNLEQMEKQTGLKDPSYQPGLVPLQLVSGFYDLVQRVYKYRVSGF